MLERAVKRIISVLYVKLFLAWDTSETLWKNARWALSANLSRPNSPIAFEPKYKSSHTIMFTLTLGRKIIFLVQDRNQVILKKKSVYKVESRYNEPLYNEVIGITNNVLYLRNSKVYTLFYKNVHFSSWVWTVLIFWAVSDWKCS